MTAVVSTEHDARNGSGLNMGWDDGVFGEQPERISFAMTIDIVRTERADYAHKTEYSQSLDIEHFRALVPIEPT